MKRHNESIAGWNMILPATLLIVIFSYIPIIHGFILSFMSGKGMNLKFDGLYNYLKLFRDSLFWQTIGNTLLYAIVYIPIMLILALMIALFLNDKRVPCKGLFRTCIFLPCVTSLVSYAILFKSIFSIGGLANNILAGIGVIASPIPFLLDSFWAKIVIILALIWRNTGYYMIFFLSALQNLDPQVNEAARIDGCSNFQTMRKITIPMLKPVFFLTSVMALNGSLQLFDEVVNLTGGGPGDATRTISQYIYDLSFTYVPTYGYAAAVSYIVLLIVLAFTVIRKKNSEI